ncbi:MAG TPA: RidA family protein [Burkholderiales bacterium]|nr:RidA family protein [Burkholderiales bacterium]
MKIRYHHPEALYESRFFTHVVSVEEPKKLVYVSGQVSYDRDGIVVHGDMREQCEQVFKSLSHALKAAGASWRDVVKINGYMVGLNPADVNVYREVRARHIGREYMPASTLVGVTRLVHEDLRIEVEVVAALGGAAKAAPAKKAKKGKKKR